MWENISQATAYKLEFFIQDSNQTQIAEFNLTNNYHRVDPLLFTVPNVAYTITAYNGSNVIKTSTTSVVPKLPDNVYGTWEDDCAINCNGRTYAWKLTAGGRAEHPAEVRLQLSNVYQYYDAENGIATPYWQAMSNSSYDNLVGNHPYKQFSSSGYPNYKKEAIDISMISGATPYRDRFNSPVSSGWLIEKKLDEFTHLNSAMTVSSASPNTDICAVDDIYYWKDFFNNYVDLTSVSMPSSVEPFMNTVPIGVECLKTYDNINVSVYDFNDYDWNAWVDSVYSSVDDIEEGIASSGDGKLFYEITSQLDKLINLNYSNDSITFVSIKSVGSQQSDAVIKRDLNGFYLLSSNGPFKAGLYEIAFRSARGNVFPTMIKFSSDLIVTQLKERIDVIAYPNPITNNELNLKITSEQALFARLILGDNTGNLIINEEIKIDKDVINTFSYDLSTTNSNYLILNVIYPDASVDQITLIKQ